MEIVRDRRPGRPPHEMAPRGFERAWIAPLAVGLALRAAYLAGAWTLPPIADEITYLEQARDLRELGVYGGKWAPGNAAVLAVLSWLFGEGAPQAARVLHVLLSVPVAVATMALARVAFGARAGRVAGWVHALYLPLVGFTHTLWPETTFLALFLPALVLLARFAEGGREATRATTLPLAGALLGAAVLFKESGLYLVPLAALWVAAFARVERGHAAVCAAVFAGSALAVLVPWTMRNWDAYRRVVPVGLTLGVNSWHGLATRYTNFDHPGLALEQVYPPESFTHRAFLADPPPTWRRAKERNAADKDRADFRRGLAFAVEHPLYFLRTRVVKLADYVTPLSFLVRNYRLDAYGPPVSSPAVRRAAVAWSVLSVPLFMVLSVLALARRRAAPGARPLIVLVLLYFVATGLFVAMSRYRAPIEPVLVACAAGLVAGTPVAPGRIARVVAPACIALLAALWIVGWPALWLGIEQAW